MEVVEAKFRLSLWQEVNLIVIHVNVVIRFRLQIPVHHAASRSVRRQAIRRPQT